MLKLRKKVVTGALAVILLGGAGLFNASAANAATGQGNYQPMMGFQAGMGGQGQQNMWFQFGAPMLQQHNQQQHNQQQRNQQQNIQRQNNQLQNNQLQNNQLQNNQLQNNQQQPAGGQFAQKGQMIGAAGGNLISQVADILDVEEQTIIDALQDGQTLVEIAGDYDVSEDELLEQLEELESDAIDEAVDAGTLTDDQADTLKEQMADYLDNIVNSMGTDSTSSFNTNYNASGYYSLGLSIITNVADILDVEEQTVIDELKDGQTLAEIAGDYDVSADELLEELVDLQSDAIDDAVDDGTLTDSQAESLKDQLTERLEQIIESTDL